MKPRGPIPVPAPHRPAKPAARHEGALESSVDGLLSAWSGRSTGAPVVQAKLQVGPVDDAFEREADDFAAQAVQHLQSSSETPAVLPTLSAAPTDTVQPSPGPEQDAELPQLIRPKLHFSGSSSGGSDAPADFTSRLQGIGGGGSLPFPLQQQLGRLSGTPLNNVRIHTGSETHGLNKSIGARAFTFGRDIFFGQGQYNPATAAGQQLIAHEVAHVGQQGGEGVVRRQPWGRPALTSVPPSCNHGSSVRAIERENRFKLKFFEEWLRHKIEELNGRSQRTLEPEILDQIDHLDLTDSYIRSDIGTILATELSNDRLVHDISRKIAGMAREHHIAKQVEQSLESQGMRSPLLGPMLYVSQDVACSLPTAVVQLAKVPFIFISGLIEGMSGSVSGSNLAQIEEKLTDFDAIMAFPFNFSAGFAYGLVDVIVEFGKEVIEFFQDPMGSIMEVIQLVITLAGEGGEEIAKNMGVELGKSVGKEIGAYADKDASDIVFQIGKLLAPLLAAIIIMLMGKMPPPKLLTPKVKKLGQWIKALRHRLGRRARGEKDWPLVDRRTKRPGVALVSEEETWRVLEKSGQIHGHQLDPRALHWEWEVVQNSELRKIDGTESGFVEEVRLPNGCTWRRHQDQSWTRFPDEARFVETTDGLRPSPKLLKSQFSENAIKTLDDLRRSTSAQKPVGRFLKEEAEAREVMAKLAKNDPSVWETLGIDLKGDRFDSDRIEWGLAYDPNTKEYFVIRGNDSNKSVPGAVDWKDYVGKADAVAHSHPYYDHLGSERKLKLEKGNGSLEEVLRDGHNQAVLLPSPEDLKFMLDFDQGKHTVVTPYRWDPETKKIVNPSGKSDLPNVIIEIDKPAQLGTSDGIGWEVSEAKVRMSANGVPLEGGNASLYLVDTPVGPMMSMDKPNLTIQPAIQPPLKPPTSLLRDDLPSPGDKARIQDLDADKVGQVLSKLKGEVNASGNKILERVQRQALAKGDTLLAKEFEYEIDPDVKGVRSSGPRAIAKAQGIDKLNVTLADLRDADEFTLAAVMHAQAKSHGGGMQIGNLFLGEDSANGAHGYWEKLALALAKAKKKVKIRGVAITNQNHAGRFFQYMIEVDGKRLLNGWLDPTKVIEGLNVPGPNTFNSVAKKLFDPKSPDAD